MFFPRTLLILAVLLTLLQTAPPGLAQTRSSTTDQRVEELRADITAAQARGDLASAVRGYEEILRIAPRLGPAYNNLGALYVRQGNYQKAAEVLERGLKVDPNMTSAAALLGVSLYELGRYAEARPRLEEATRANPADTDMELFLANDLTKVGDFEAAVEHFQHVSSKRPDDQHVLYLLARVYMQLGQQALTRMNALDPNSVWAHEISGEIMEGMKNYDGAIVEYKKALEAAPKQPGTHYKLGDLYWSISQWDAAAEQFQAELSNDPHNCMARWKLGDILVQQSVRPEEALTTIDKSLAMCPNLAEARLDRGKVLLQLHRNQEALADLQAAEKQMPDEASVHFLLARAYRALGRPRDAQSEMQLFSALEEKTRRATAERAQEIIKSKETRP
jgi:tetratricopeptide (TPR) repeat protein